MLEKNKKTNINKQGRLIVKPNYFPIMFELNFLIYKRNKKYGI